MLKDSTPANLCSYWQRQELREADESIGPIFGSRATEEEIESFYDEREKEDKEDPPCGKCDGCEDDDSGDLGDFSCAYWERQEYRDTKRLLPENEEHRKQVLEAEDKEDMKDGPCGKCPVCWQIGMHALNPNEY